MLPYLCLSRQRQRSWSAAFGLPFCQLSRGMSLTLENERVLNDPDDLYCCRVVLQMISLSSDFRRAI